MTTRSALSEPEEQAETIAALKRIERKFEVMGEALAMALQTLREIAELRNPRFAQVRAEQTLTVVREKLKGLVG